MPLSTNKVEKFVVSGKFNCVYLANLADGSINEYQEKNSFSSKNKKGLSIAIYGWSNFSSEDNGMWLFVSRSTSDGDSLNWCKCKYRCHGNVFGLRIDSMEMHEDVYFAHYKNRKGAFVKFHIWFYKRGISSLGKTLLECKPPVASQFLLIVLAYLACR